MLIARRVTSAAAGGLLMFIAFPDIGWWIAAPLAAAVMMLTVRGATGRGGFGYGWIFGMVFFLGHLWWAYLAVGTVPWIALAAAESVAFGLVGWLHARLVRSGRIERAPWSEPFVFAALWVGAELLRSAVPFGGFPWGRIAFSSIDTPVARLAWLGGAPLVSFAVVAAGGLAALAVVSLRERRFVTMLAAPVVAIVLWMAPMLLPLTSQAETGTATIAWAQGDLANEGLDSFNRAREVTHNHLLATQDLGEREPNAQVDLVIWPENASDIDPRADSETAQVVTDAARVFDAPLLFGTNDFSAPGGRWNLSMVWLPSGEPLEGVDYAKQVPAAFAEYIPMRSFARLFSDEVDRVTSEVIPGSDPAYLAIPSERLGRDLGVGPIICFEVAYDWVPREASRLGAEFLAVQTNNATFGLTPESTQQLQMSRLRAIETGKATLQVSTVGVSAVISPTGKVLDETELFTRDGGVATIPLRTSLTPATHWGGPISLVFAAAAGLLGLVALTSRTRGKSV